MARARVWRVHTVCESRDDALVLARLLRVRAKYEQLEVRFRVRHKGDRWWFVMVRDWPEAP